MTAPIDDPLVATLEHLFEGQEGNTKLLAEIGRDVDSMSHELTGAVEEFGKLHGELQALEHEEAQERRRMHEDIRKMDRKLDLMIDEMRSVLKNRLTPLEGRVAGLELHLKSNGNGAG